MYARFWRVLVAYAISTLGDEFFTLALPLVLLEQAYPAATVTFLRGAVTAATVVAGFGVGYLVDRHSTTWLLTVSYMAPTAVLAVGMGAIAAGVASYPVIFVATAVLGVFAAVSAATVDAGVPRVCEPAKIRHGYSLVEGARTVATMLGPALAGVLASTRSLITVLGVNAGSFAAAAAVTRTAGRDSAVRPEGAGSAVRQIAEGARVVLRNRQLRLGIALSLVANVTLGADQPLFLTRMVRGFGVSPLWTSVTVIGAGGIAIAVSLGVTRYSRAVSPRNAMTVSVMLIAVAAIGMGTLPVPAAVAGMYCVLAAGTVCYTVFWRAYRQDIVPAQLLGRASAACRSLAYTGVVIGTVVVGILQEAGVSPGALLVWGGAICVAGSGLVALWQAREAPAEPAHENADGAPGQLSLKPPPSLPGERQSRPA